MMDSLIFPFIGLIIGITISLSGMGGGALTTPILLLLGIPSQTAICTDLLFASLTKTANLTFGAENFLKNKKIIFLMILSSLTGMILTSIFLKDTLKSSEKLNFILPLILAAILIATASALVMINIKLKKSDPKAISFDTNPYPFISFKKAFITFLAAALIGCLVLLTSVGSGALGIATLLLLYPKLPIKEIVIIDISYAIPLTLFSWFSLWYFTNYLCDFMLLGQLLIGSIAGTILSKISFQKVKESFVRLFVASLLFLISIKLVIKSFS